jgi:hypothetical protein
MTNCCPLHWYLHELEHVKLGKHNCNFSFQIMKRVCIFYLQFLFLTSYSSLQLYVHDLGHVILDSPLSSLDCQFTVSEHDMNQGAHGKILVLLVKDIVLPMLY